jgi:nucleoid-associated protein YgaU
VPTYRVGDAARGGAELYQPRLRDQPAEAATRHTVAASDRLDLLSWTYLGDPYQYWRIADANPDADLEEILEPGRSLRIPRKPS